MNRTALTLVPPPSAADTFDARRQAMLRSWREALPNMPPDQRCEEIISTTNAMQMLSDIDG